MPRKQFENEVNSYSMQISDTESTYLAAVMTPLPEISVTADLETDTNKLKVDVNASPDTETFYSSDDRQTWIKFEGDLYLTRNAFYYFKAVDADGTESNYTTLDVTNIETDAPELSVTYTPDYLINGDVIITASATDQHDYTIYYKKSGDSDFTKYEKDVVVTENGIYEFHAEDSLGNKSTVQTINITNIDKVAPTLEISGNATEWTNKDVVLSATASDDRGATVFYKKSGDANFTEYNGEITVSENGKYIFYTVDGLGNTSAEQIVEVTNIDKVAPELNISGNPTEWTNQDVILKAEVNDILSGVKSVEFKVGDAEWATYNSETGVIVSNNSAVYFKVDVPRNRLQDVGEGKSPAALFAI